MSVAGMAASRSFFGSVGQMRCSFSTNRFTYLKFTSFTIQYNKLNENNKKQHESRQSGIVDATFCLAKAVATSTNKVEPNKPLEEVQKGSAEERPDAGTPGPPRAGEKDQKIFRCRHSIPLCRNKQTCRYLRESFLVSPEALYISTWMCGQGIISGL